MKKKKLYIKDSLAIYFDGSTLGRAQLSEIFKYKTINKSLNLNLLKNNSNFDNFELDELKIFDLQEKSKKWINKK